MRQPRNIFQKVSYSKTLTTSAAPAGIRIVEIETFAIKSVTEIKFGIHQIQEAFKVGDNFQALVFKNLVGRLDLVVKIHLIAEAAASAAHHTYPQKIRGVFRNTCVLHQVLHLLQCLIAHIYGILCAYHVVGSMYDTVFEFDRLHSVLFAIVVDGSLDSILCQHATVNLYRRKIQLFHYFHVVDLQRFIDTFALQPLGSQ